MSGGNRRRFDWDVARDMYLRGMRQAEIAAHFGVSQASVSLRVRDLRSVERRYQSYVADYQSQDGCWLWRGALNSSGYASFFNGERVELAHRYAYRLAFGQIGEGLQVDHLCGQRSCVNPAHLEAVTPRENSRRANLRDECLRGHPYSGDNLYVNRFGKRTCRACDRIYAQRYRDQRKAAA